MFVLANNQLWPDHKQPLGLSIVPLGTCIRTLLLSGLAHKRTTNEREHPTSASQMPTQVHDNTTSKAQRDSHDEEGTSFVGFEPTRSLPSCYTYRVCFVASIEEGSVTPPPFGLVVGWVGGDEKIMLQTAPDEI